MKKLVTTFMLLTALFFSSISPLFSQNYQTLYQEALIKEEGEGSLLEAIEIYNQIVEDKNAEPLLQAKALLHVGYCYEKLGMTEATKAYQDLVNNYPSQKNEVALARERLSRLVLIAEKLAQKSEKVAKSFNIQQVSPGTKLDFLGGPEPGAAFIGEPSPDGKYFSYTDWNTGNLAIYEFATGKKHSLTNTGSINPASAEFAFHSRWSSDGKQIVYDWFNENGVMDLRIIGLDGSEPRILYNNPEMVWIQCFDLSTDGKQILASFLKKDQIAQIGLVSTTDGSVQILERKFSGGEMDLVDWTINMEFSPDGRYIIYDIPQKEDNDVRDIYLLSTDGSEEYSLVEHPANDYILGWAPDGENILFASDRRGSLDVWSIPVSDGKPQGTPELVKADIGQRFQPLGFTKEGSFYYGKKGGRNKDINIVNFNPETGKIIAPPKIPITRFKGTNRLPDYSPNGKYLAYVSGKRDMPANSLIIHSLETGDEQEFITNFKGIYKYIWSPDCSSILFPGEDEEGRVGIYQIDVKTGSVNTVVQPSSGAKFEIMQWSDDGKSFIIARILNSDKLFQIVIREIESGKEKELYRVSPDNHLLYPNKINNQIIYSPDGKWISFINIVEKGVLRIMPATGGDPRELYKCDNEDDNFVEIRWSPDGKYIFSILEHPKQKKSSILRIPFEGGEAQKILEMDIVSPWTICKLSIHPNGKQIAFQTVSDYEDAELWVMENFLSKEETGKK